MTLSNDIQKIANEDGITPDFELLKNYSKFSSDQFYHKYLYYKATGLFKNSIGLIREHKLKSHQNELFFFLVEIAEKYAIASWAKDVGLAREDLKALEQMKKLHLFCQQIQTHGGYKKPGKSLEPTMKKINLFTDKNLSISIDSHKLCVTLIELFENHYFLTKSKLDEKMKGLKNRNPRQHEKQFIQGLKPFITYLEKETIQWETRNSIYDFVSQFIRIVGIEMEATRIESALKVRRH
jgi:hypothetical protein